MGRGRAKAKQTKVARELKYHTLDTDFSALQRELGSPEHPSTLEDGDEADGDTLGTAVPAYDEDERASRHG